MFKFKYYVCFLFARIGRVGILLSKCPVVGFCLQINVI